MERRAWAHRGTSAPSSRSIDAAIGELRRLNAEVLAAAEQLKPVTIETLLARSDLAESLRIRHEFQRERVLYRWSCSRLTRVSELGSGGFAGHGVGNVFRGTVLTWADAGNSGGGELTAQRGVHVGGRWGDLGFVPGAR